MSRLLPTIALGLCLSPASAGAQLRVCNDTGIEIYVVLAAPSDSTDGSGWISRGWFVFGPYECGDLVAELRYRHYYLYAEETRFRASVRLGDREVWGHSNDRPLIYGEYPFCISPSDAFEVADRADCEGRGYRSAGFMEVDVGDHGLFIVTVSPRQ
jgi:uncharacterized membrane protein